MSIDVKHEEQISENIKDASLIMLENKITTSYRNNIHSHSIMKDTKLNPNTGNRHLNTQIALPRGLLQPFGL
ncbi:CLUMA_CG019889, isoform A [Clunio marinus]|uniref:CLUMA_CG019889, isoform A n=1 Tax=Clunio marinus TaxID=568069 RepID=A0A1J1J445_9DIPT|nr:CLUMA_CG019889, isoform A [Clunio marinus]